MFMLRLFTLYHFCWILSCSLPYTPADTESNHYHNAHKYKDERPHSYIHLTIVNFNPLSHDNIADRESYQWRYLSEAKYIP